MKWLWLCVILFSVITTSSIAQTVDNPIDFLAGQWIQKTTSIDPAPENDDWKSIVALNEFTPILKGKGLYRTITTENRVIEGYFFYDAGSKKVYGMSVDDNGYVWQTESVLDGQGKLTGNKGGPIHDSNISFSSELELVDKNEVRFTQKLTEDGKTTTLKGVFIRVPGTSRY